MAFQLKERLIICMDLDDLVTSLVEIPCYRPRPMEKNNGLPAMKEPGKETGI